MLEFHKKFTHLTHHSSSMTAVCIQGAPLLSGVKYILRTELVFERQATPLTPACATEEEWKAWNQIERLYQASEVCLHHLSLFPLS